MKNEQEKKELSNGELENVAGGIIPGIVTYNIKVLTPKGLQILCVKCNAPQLFSSNIIDQVDTAIVYSFTQCRSCKDSHNRVVTVVGLRPNDTAGPNMDTYVDFFKTTGTKPVTRYM